MEQLAPMCTALQSLPALDTKDLFEALQRVPHLVDAESNFTSSLHRENLDATATAKRLATYWRRRKELFGDRAFLPMTLDGCGAMEPMDVAAFRLGYLMPLPLDRDGRGVLFADASRLEEIPHAQLMRCFFYTFQVLSDEHQATTRGIVALGVGSFNRQASTKAYKEAICFLTEAFGLSIHRVHVFCSVEDKVINEFYATCARLVVACIGILGLQRTLFHTSSTLDTCKAKLLSLGILEDSIPPRLGGTYFIQTRNLNERTTKPMFRSPIATGRDGPLRYPSVPQLIWGPSSDVQSPCTLVRENFAPDSHLLLESTRQRHAILGSPVFVGVSHDDTKPQNGISLSTEALRCDLDEYSRFGFDRRPLVQETEELRHAGRMAVVEALRKLPYSETAAYLEALRIVPGIVESESDAMLFVRATHYDSRLAAMRLANYWTLRKELFGDNAFLPMAPSGHGAVSKEDINVLSCGEVALLPSDKLGRSVLVSDRTRVIDQIDGRLQSRLRVLFYLLSTVAQSKMNQLDGVVWIDVFAASLHGGVSVTEIETTVQLMNSMPCRVKAAHLILQPSERCEGEDDGLARVVRAVRVGLGQKVMVHCGDSTSSILEKLQPFGLLECSLPPILGGSRKYEEVSNWQQLRVQFEGGSTIEASHDTKNQSSLCATEGKKRRNLLNRICSCRKRERRRSELGILLQHYEGLMRQSRKPTKESSHLEHLRASAVSMTEKISKGHE